MENTEKLRRILELKKEIIEGKSIKNNIGSVCNCKQKEEKIIPINTITKENPVKKFFSNFNFSNQSVFIGSNGKKYKCKYGENADGSCINGELTQI